MNSGFTGIRLVPYLRAQYESLKEPKGLILQATEARPDGLLSTWARQAPRCERTGAGRRMQTGPRASSPAAEGSARECVARPEGRHGKQASGIQKDAEFRDTETF
jgi:hypothetical protein